MFAFVLACAHWDHTPCCSKCTKPCRSTSLTGLLDGLCCLFIQFTTPCRYNDLIQELENAKQEAQDLQATNERHVVQTEQLQGNLRATERSRNYYQAQLQQVGPLVQRRAVLRRLLL